MAWIVGLGFFFPVFWMVLTSFKQEVDALHQHAEAVLLPDTGSVSRPCSTRASGRRC